MRRDAHEHRREIPEVGAGGHSMIVDLMAFRVECEPGRHEFYFWTVSPDSYGIIPASTADQRAMVLLPTDNAIWKDIKSRAARLSEEVSLSPPTRRNFSDALLTATLDRLPAGAPWYLWGDIPCPICGSPVRSFLAPAKPGRHQSREIEYGTQACWEALSEVEREAIARSILLQFRADWYFRRNPRSMP